MTIHLNDVWSALGGLGALVTVLGFIFFVLRYIIRAETSELRANGGKSVKDRVDKTADLAEETKAALDQHIADSKSRIERGAEVEQELRTALADVARSLPIVAASTPPEAPNA